MTRRTLLRFGVGAAVVGTLPAGLFPTAAEAAPARTSGTGLAGMTMATFTPLLNTQFKFQVGPGRFVIMPLTAVTNEVPAARRTASGGECFSLIFGGATRSKVEQGTYAVTHSTLGQFRLFVVPVGLKAKGRDFQAVVNRVTH